MICGREEIRGFSEVAGVMSLGDFLEETIQHQALRGVRLPPGGGGWPGLISRACAAV